MISRFSGLLCLFGTRCSQNLFKQYAGTAVQRNPPQNQRSRNISQSGFLPTAGNNMSHGICGRLVCFQSILKPKIHSFTVKRSLIHFSEPLNCELSLTLLGPADILLDYMANPILILYSAGLNPPRDILILISRYHTM
jgi:hypothetical protein